MCMRCVLVWDWENEYVDLQAYVYMRVCSSGSVAHLLPARKTTQS